MGLASAVKTMQPHVLAWHSMVLIVDIVILKFSTMRSPVVFCFISLWFAKIFQLPYVLPDSASLSICKTGITREKELAKGSGKYPQKNRGGLRSRTQRMDLKWMCCMCMPAMWRGFLDFLFVGYDQPDTTAIQLLVSCETLYWQALLDT